MDDVVSEIASTVDVSSPFLAGAVVSTASTIDSTAFCIEDVI